MNKVTVLVCGLAVGLVGCGGIETGPGSNGGKGDDPTGESRQETCEQKLEKLISSFPSSGGGSTIAVIDGVPGQNCDKVETNGCDYARRVIQHEQALGRKQDLDRKVELIKLAVEGFGKHGGKVTITVMIVGDVPIVTHLFMYGPSDELLRWKRDGVLIEECGNAPSVIP